MSPFQSLRAWLAARREAKQKALLRARLIALGMSNATLGCGALSP